MTISTEDLRKLLDEATPGPWGWDGLKLYGFAGEQVIDHAGYEGMWFASYGQPEKQVANAAIMAIAPTLVAELITARAKIEAAEKLAEAVRNVFVPQEQQREMLFVALAAWESLK